MADDEEVCEITGITQEMLDAGVSALERFLDGKVIYDYDARSVAVEVFLSMVKAHMRATYPSRTAGQGGTSGLS